MDVTRRKFLRQVGAVGALGGAAILAATKIDRGDAPVVHAKEDPLGSGHGSGGHGGNVTVGEVNHDRNGFDPHRILTDFDTGDVSTDRTGRTVREYRFVAVDKDIEVAPGVFFPAWTYNGRVPGPTIRCREGDRVRVELVNASGHGHSIHFHGIHPSGMDGVLGAGTAEPGGSFTYDFIAEPFGTHLYHCHTLPLTQHIHHGLYGAFIVDPKEGRPAANEMVMVMNGFDTNFDGGNEVYAANSIAFAYAVKPITINLHEPQRIHLINLLEFDLLNSIHIHANFFHLYRTGTSLTSTDFTDTISMAQGERHMLEFTYRFPGRFMFHAHQSEFAELGWLGHFEVV